MSKNERAEAHVIGMKVGDEISDVRLADLFGIPAATWVIEKFYYQDHGGNMILESDGEGNFIRIPDKISFSYQVNNKSGMMLDFRQDRSFGLSRGADLTSFTIGDRQDLSDLYDRIGEMLSENPDA